MFQFHNQIKYIFIFFLFNFQLLFSINGIWNVTFQYRVVSYIGNGTTYYHDNDFIDIKNCDENNICILTNLSFKIPVILHSTNAGNSWYILKDTIHVKDGLGNMNEGATLAYPSKNLIFIGCDSGYYWRTTDAGKTWVYKQTKFKKGFYKTTFIDSNNGIAIQYTNQDELIKTTDAGNSWESANYKSYSDSSLIAKLFFFKPNTLLIVEVIEYLNGLYRIGKSTNQGQTWSYENFYTNHRFNFNFISENVGFNSGGNNAQKIIKKTTDAGKTWRTVLDTIIPPAYGIFDISFYDSLHGVANGIWQIWKTTDGGEKWFNDTTYNYKRDSVKSVGMVKYISKDRIVGFSTHGLDFIYLNDMSKTDVAEETIKVTSQKIFPNPISSGSKLKIQGIEYIEDVNLYDLSGISTKLEANGNEIKIPYALSPGFYVLQYRAGGLMYREKIIIIE